MNQVEVFSKDNCPYCVRAKALLASKDVSYEEIDVSRDSDMLVSMMQRSKQRTVPQIFINGQSIGGYDDLAKLNKNGELDQILGL